MPIRRQPHSGTSNDDAYIQVFCLSEWAPRRRKDIRERSAVFENVENGHNDWSHRWAKNRKRVHDLFVQDVRANDVSLCEAMIDIDRIRDKPC